MKNFLFLIALLFTGFVASAQNGNQGSFVISESRLIESGGIGDVIEIRLSGPAANVWTYMSASPTYTTRVSSIPFQKVDGQSTENGQGNQGNGNTSLWRATIDASSVTDPNTGEIELDVNGGPYCCNIPQGGLIVKIKAKK